ncbi:MAG: hypothetical protein ABSA65_11750 [Acidimicrobiales bacterium]
MSIFKSSRDASEVQRESHRAITEALERNRARADEAHWTNTRPRQGKTAAQAEAEAKERVAAATAIRAERQRQLQLLTDFKDRALGAADTATRDAAIRRFDLEEALEAQRKISASTELVAAVDAAIAQAFPGVHIR